MTDIYNIRKTKISPAPDDSFDSSVWSKATIMTLSNRYLGTVPEHGFTPGVQCKFLYGNGYIFGRYRVNDRYILIRAEKDQDCVCVDSCVEFFIRPANNLRYYNFEFSAGGVMRLCNCTDRHNGLYEPIPLEDCAKVIRASTLPPKVDPEQNAPVTWEFFFAIPVAFFVKYGDQVDSELSGQIWTGNVTKCANKTSHPCWLSWQLLPKLDFHRPEHFGTFIFDNR